MRPSPRRGGGIDTVESAITFSLATQANVENLTLTRRGTSTAPATRSPTCSSAIPATTSSMAAPARTCSRAARGNDIYVVDNAGDIVDEERNTDTGDEVKRERPDRGRVRRRRELHLHRRQGLDLHRRRPRQPISGGSAADNLNGAGGNDTLLGNGGNDSWSAASATMAGRRRRQRQDEGRRRQRHLCRRSRPATRSTRRPMPTPTIWSQSSISDQPADPRRRPDRERDAHRHHRNQRHRQCGGQPSDRQRRRQHPRRLAGADT